jgi:hypothetical protein
MTSSIDSDWPPRFIEHPVVWSSVTPSLHSTLNYLDEDDGIVRPIFAAWARF